MPSGVAALILLEYVGTYRRKGTAVTIDEQKLRLMGVYRQDKEGHYMLRVKIPAGVLAVQQALTICSLSEEFSNGMLHLTCRGSIEFHWLKQEYLADFFQRLQNVGLTTRGACGGAVRGISCSTTFSANFPAIHATAQKLNSHFAGNPEFEGLPKKFKIGIDAGYEGSRHLIQDMGLVLIGYQENQPCFDVWCAGGLGREPQPAFLLSHNVREESLIHLIESVVQIYREHTPPPKRLKHLLNQIGEKEFRRLLEIELSGHPRKLLPALDTQGPSTPEGLPFEVPVFAGELSTRQLRKLAEAANTLHTRVLAITNDQNVVFFTSQPGEQEALAALCSELNKEAKVEPEIKKFRICPGNHECRMGLSATRDIARHILATVPVPLRSKTWAICGCPNSCSQPQLADFGIITRKLSTNNGIKQPLFDLYQRRNDCLGQTIAEELTIETLSETIRTLK